MMHTGVESILHEVQKVIVGKDDVLEKILMTILSGGHVLLDDVPGTGKTTTALAFSRALMEGRDYVLPDDVAYIFSDVCAHRLILSAKARITETSASDVLAEVLAAVPRPDRI